MSKKVDEGKKPDESTLKQIADYIVNELSSRKQRRSMLEKHWGEIDRQLRMEPDSLLRLDADGRVDKNQNWIPRMELPLQAQTLEVLTADARRMEFPDSGPWFSPHSALTDTYLERVDFESLLAGDKNDVPTKIDQDAADKLVHGVVSHWHRQYDFEGNMDAINSEAFKYGMGIGRSRLVKKKINTNTAKGVVSKDKMIPILVPRSIKSTYLDDNPYSLMNEGFVIGKSTITCEPRMLEDLILAAKFGSKDKDSGWMPEALNGFEGDKDGKVEIAELEGDLVVPLTDGSSGYWPGAIVSVAVGEKDAKVIRIRFNETNESSIIEFPYHVEHIDTAYPASPLMKGRPIQIAAVDALTRYLMASAYDAQPAVQYSPDDTFLNSKGGPQIYPGANIPSVDPIAPLKIGNPAALLNGYIGLVNQYYDVTGVNAPRLGAQTNSHTTAFAKDAEITRGTIRTVDYVRSSLSSGLTKWLDVAYKLGRSHLKNETIYIEQYNGFVEVSTKHLPETVSFEVHGSGGPAEEQAKKQRRLEAAQLALQVHGLGVQSGQDSGLDLTALVEQILREGGWTDVDTILPRDVNTGEGPAGIPENESPLGGNPGILTAAPGGLPV